MDNFQPLYQYGDTIGIVLVISTVLVFCIPFFLKKYEEKYPQLLNTTLLISSVLSICIGFSLIFFDDAHNDVYRYLWDGKASAMGLNVYETIPRETYEQLLMANDQLLIDNQNIGVQYLKPEESQYSQELFNKTGFKHYYTTYPPTMQLVLWGSAEIFPLSQRGLKFIFYLFFLGSLFLVYKIYKTDDILKNWIPVFFLSPLMLWEGIAAAHSEVLFVFFLLLSLFCFQQKKFFWTGVSLAALTWVKFFPAILGLIFLVGIWRTNRGPSSQNSLKRSGEYQGSIEKGRSESILCFSGSRISANAASGTTGICMFICGGIMTTILLWLPFLPFNPEHFFDALQLYSSEWRMFPLVFEIVENQFSFQIAQLFQLIGTIGVMGFVLYAGYKKKMKIDEQIFWTLFAYLLLSSTIFSWYFLWILPLAIFVLARKKLYILMFGLLITPCLQHFFTVWDPIKQIFYYEGNGLEIEQKLYFWSIFLICVIFQILFLPKNR